MALTSAQEAVVIQMLAAFEGGKRIQDLPEVDGTNPFNLVTHVIDKDGESKKAALASMLPYLESQCAYGIERDKTVSSPACTRIGNADLHRSLPIHNRMKGCLLNDDGEVVEYLPPESWLGSTRDGSRGQVMVEIPDHYRKFETSGNKQRVKISEHPLPGYHHVPKMYISAYEAALQRTGNKLSSVVNDSADFRGCGNQSAWDGTCRSALGRPVTGISRTNFRAYARNRKAGSTEWNCMTYEAQKTLYWLFVIEYATLNSQAAYNPQLTSEGYRQGGLGDGVTTWDWNSWSIFNGNYPFIPCGYTDHHGNKSGIVDYYLYTENGDYIDTFTVPRYRGIENPFGHIWKWTDGINIRISPNAPTGDGLSKVFVCDDPEKFTDSNYNGYSHVGNEARNEGYVKEIIFGEYGEIMPSVSSGAGSTTYFCDYHYTNIPSAETLRGVLFGGDAHNGAYAGFAFAYTNGTPSVTYANVGSRLCFFPKA